MSECAYPKHLNLCSEMSIEEIELFKNLNENVKEISQNLITILRVIPGTLLENLKTKLNLLCIEIRLLRDNINCLNEAHLPKVQQVIGDLRSELNISQTSLSRILKDAKKYSSDLHASKLDSLSLRKQIAKQEELKTSLQQQLMQETKQNSHLQEQLLKERSMCTIMGGTLACMLWRACRESDVVSSILTWYKFPEFLRMVGGTLESFISTYVLEDSDPLIPSSGSKEGHFVAGMLGTVTNMLASPAGREGFITGEEGQELLLCMTECLSQIPAKQGDYLRRLILMAFYNVIIDELGLQFLWKQESFPKAMMKNLLQINDECRSMSLHILAIFTSSHPPLETLAVLRSVKMEDLKKISKNTGEDSKLAMEIMKNILI